MISIGGKIVKSGPEGLTKKREVYLRYSNAASTRVPPGVYVITASSGAERFAKKVVVAR